MRLSSRLVFPLVLGLLLTASCNNGGDTAAAPKEFWGAIASSPALASVRFEQGLAGQRVSVYVTDGFPNGISEFFEGAVAQGAFSLTSASGNAQIDATTTAGPRVEGTLRLPGGRLHYFIVKPISNGGGRYEVSITADGRWSGTGPDGNTLEARQEGDFVSGVLTTREGQRFEYRLHDLSRVLAFGAAGGQPDRYTLFVSPRGLSQLGRGGGADVAEGSPNANFVNVDLPISSEILPGIFFGRLRFQTDLLLVDVNAPTVADGPRGIRVYVSDGEPEPEGDIAWFQGEFSGNDFQLTAAGGGATISGTVTAAGASGTVTFDGGPALPFFAGPAGEGAGVYDVTVDNEGRVRGTSEEGGILDLRIDGTSVTGTLTTPAGTALAVNVVDLVRALRYPDFERIATAPETYVAFLAPHGRYIVGRSGSVRTGSTSCCVIGIDKHD